MVSWFNEYAPCDALDPSLRWAEETLASGGVISEHESSAPLKVLFVCSQNRMRSLTAEKILQGVPGLEARSAGIQPDARIVVTEGHLGWADWVFCMEKSHLNRLRRKFPEAMQTARTACLHIPDDYEYMQPELIDELRAKLSQHIPWISSGSGSQSESVSKMALRARSEKIESDSASSLTRTQTHQPNAQLSGSAEPDTGNRTPSR